MNAEYLDLFLLHRPSPLMHPDEITKGIEKLLNDGKIKSFGVSNFSNGQTDLISTSSKVSANQIQFSLSHNTPLFDSTLDYMMINNITPMSWSPLGSFFKNQNDNKKVHDLLSDLSKKSNTSKVFTTSCRAKFKRDNWLASLNRSLLIIPSVVGKAGIWMET